MALEIERRFLVRKDIRHLCRDGISIVQGYLPRDGDNTVRVRLISDATAGDTATLTIKSRKSGASREELEYPLGSDFARQLLRHSCAGHLIRKTRYRHDQDGLCWEIDVFEGENAGLVIAEVELSDPEQIVPLPEWIGAEVTSLRAYSNSSLSRCPIRGWASAA
ncbi:CYTH domain-containing protein [Azospirillum doebereinerae]|uniref:CYTH domain-containing protein n=1 Tax=Azospirillum doebereinerae TaxID=92933 RepID=A0A433J507_9PROT|nr:CYTH domain-containing protein [Azospirillum doebereinerae]MCG5240807.1 CYTH domain-containing protein [Azospirillum doebereinerae]RUQ67515.1 CYTH domain-containing protein [Azospirillum doebereinerae]